MTPLTAALWTIALWFLEMTCVYVTQAARPGAIDDIVNLGACTALATSLVIFAMVRVHAREASLRATLGVAPVAPLHLALAIAAGAGLYPLLSTIDDRMVAHWPYSPDDTLAMERLFAVPTMSSRIALVVVGFVLIPIARELFFRGIVFSEIMRSTSARVATVASALLFTLSELDWRSLPTTLVLGLALARLRERTGTVLAAAAAHVAFFAVAGIPILNGRDTKADVVFSPRWIVGGAIIALLALVAVGAGRREE
ncbi:MAG TPA: CPBP family intramembrane glutamic endopeptidase [Polyangiaceae bacterium]